MKEKESGVNIEQISYKPSRKNLRIDQNEMDKLRQENEDLKEQNSNLKEQLESKNELIDGLNWEIENLRLMKTIEKTTYSEDDKMFLFKKERARKRFATDEKRIL